MTFNIQVLGFDSQSPTLSWSWDSNGIENRVNLCRMASFISVDASAQELLNANITYKMELADTRARPSVNVVLDELGLLASMMV